MDNIPQEKIDDLYNKLISAAARKGYFLNPNEADAKGLVAGLLKAKEKYGYMSCPCRLAANDIKRDGDIICPCIYRAEDIAEFGNCFCALFVSPEVYRGEQKVRSIPERRPKEKQNIF
jgi:ferredoxin-thioredoxin reductase catalytic subunit